MSDINVVIVDPGGYRFNQLLDSYMAMRALVPLLVARLGLPDELKYQLIPRATGRPMNVTDTLAGIGVSPGSEIDLRPVRDDAFGRIVEGLRKKAEGYVVDQLWAPAKEQLDKLFRIDPENREAQQLQSQIAIHIDITAPSSPAIFPAAGSPSTAASTGQPATAQTTSAGCWIVMAIIVVGIIVYNKWPEKTNNYNQTQGSFNVKLIPTDKSYYFTVAGKSGDRISVTVRGTDTFAADFQGVGSLRTTEIPPAKQSGVRDTITVRSMDTGEVQVFTFDFR